MQSILLQIGKIFKFPSTSKESEFQRNKITCSRAYTGSSEVLVFQLYPPASAYNAQALAVHLNSASANLCSVLLDCSAVTAGLHLMVHGIPSISQAGHFGFITQLPSQSNADLGDLKMGVSLILSLETGFDFKEFYLLTVSRLLR